MKSQLFCQTQIFLCQYCCYSSHLFWHLNKRSRLHIDCIEVLLKIFALFSVALWSLKWLIIRHIIKLNLINVASNARKWKTLYVGDENEKLVSSLRKSEIQKDSNWFLQKASLCICYCCSLYSKKYALNNPLLKSFCALDPRLRLSSLTHENLLNLKPYFETFLSSGCGKYSSEIQKYVTDSELLLPEEKERLDVWWNKVLKTNRYLVLSSLVQSYLRIFMDWWWNAHSAWWMILIPSQAVWKLKPIAS